MIDLHRFLDRPVAQEGGAEVDDVDEQDAAIGKQFANSPHRAGDVEKMIDGLTDDDHVETALAEVNVLDKPLDRLDAERLRLGGFERSGIDDGRLQPESFGHGAGHDPGRPSNVQHRPVAASVEIWREQVTAIGRVLPLLALYGAGVDEAAVI